jgi:hypothetical protein
MHIEFLVEEPSMAAALECVVPAIAGTATYAVRQFQGKQDLLRRLPDRLRGYRTIPGVSVVVLVDQHTDDCRKLKQHLDECARDAGLVPKSQSADSFRALNRVVVDELEAWFFGDADALRAAFPRLPAYVTSKRSYRNPDGIPGGAARALEHELRQAGAIGRIFSKPAVATRVAAHMDPCRNTSPSFRAFISGIDALLRVESS